MITKSIIFAFILSQVGRSLSENVDLEFFEAADKFAVDAYSKIVEFNTGSVIFSPASIHQVLTMASFGAVARTQDEMIAGLKYPDDYTSDDIARNCKTLTENVKQSAFLKMANNVYFMQGNTIQPAFDTIARNSFGSASQALNFTKNQEAAKTINNWVESQTNGKIKDLIPPGDLDNDTRVVLVNAIYFLGNWKFPFNPDKTKKETFYNSGVNPISVDMMFMKNDFMYKELPKINATALNLAYKDSDIAMLFILPNALTGLRDLEESLRVTSFAAILENMETTKVIVQLPKFKIETEIELQDTLKAMGMLEMFTDKANFAAMLKNTDGIKVSKVIHKAFIEVNELGTEAAAATAIIGKGSGSGIPRFVADHPFIFAIHNADGIYFTGRVSKI